MFLEWPTAWSLDTEPVTSTTTPTVSLVTSPEGKMSRSGVSARTATSTCVPNVTVHASLMSTKGHVIQTGTDMPLSMADKPPRYEACDDHPKRLKDQFCYHHGTLICLMCCSASHSMCDNKSVEDTCKYIQLIEVDNLCDANKNYKSQLSFFLSSVDKRGGKLIDQRQTLLTDAQTAYDKFIAEIKKSYQNMKTYIKVECDLQDAAVSQFKQGMNAQISLVDTEINFTNKVRGKPINVNTFLSLQESVSKTRKCVVAIESMKKSLNITSLIFEPSKYVQMLLAQPVDFGFLNRHRYNVDVDISIPDINFPNHIKGSTKPVCTSNQEGLPKLESKKSSFGQIKARLIDIFNVRTEGDKRTCWITSVAITSCGQKLLLDYNNDSVKLFSQDMRFLFSVKVQHGRSITMFNDMEAVVTTGRSLVVFLEVANEKLGIKQTVNLSFDCFGITHSKDNLICTDGRQLHTIDRQGRKQLLGGQSSFKNSMYVCGSSDGRWIAATDSDKTITVLDANNGAVITSRQLEMTNVGWPTLGVAVDTSGNIFICRDKQIIVMSGDLKNERVLFNMGDNTRAIAYDRTKHQLVLSQDHNDSVYCLQLVNSTRCLGR